VYNRGGISCPGQGRCKSQGLLSTAIGCFIELLQPFRWSSHRPTKNACYSPLCCNDWLLLVPFYVDRTLDSKSTPFTLQQTILLPLDPRPALPEYASLRLNVKNARCVPLVMDEEQRASATGAPPASRRACTSLLRWWRCSRLW